MEEVPLPGLSKREIFESMGPGSIVDHILGLGEKATQIETEMNLASEVLEGCYGLTVEEVLRSRELEDTREFDIAALLKSLGDNKNGAEA